jgi:hypothetical protein
MKFMRVLAAAALLAAAIQAATVPSGTRVRVRMGQTISSEKARSGEAWDGTLAEDLVVGGKVIAKRGAAVSGKVVTAKASGRLSDPGLLQLQLRSIHANGQQISVLSNTISRKGESHKGRNVKSAGGGAVLGAVIGAIAGGGKGAAIGAGAGAAAGTAGAAATGKKDVTIPVETVLTFTVR